MIKYHFAPFQITILVVISEVQPCHPAFYSTAFTPINFHSPEEICLILGYLHCRKGKGG